MSATAHKPAALLTAIAPLAALLVYANAVLHGVFQFDDFNVIVDNPVVHSWAAWRNDLAHGIRPLLKLTYTLDWTSGFGATGFHITNLAIHCTNTLLVHTLTQRFAETQTALRTQPGTIDRIALFTALLFAVHPLHSEAVTYICGRSGALMTTFYLAATLAYLTGREAHHRNQPNRRNRNLYLVTPVCFLLALGVKETAATLPPALLVLELCCGGDWRTALRRQWPVWLLLAAGGVFFLMHDGYLRTMTISAGLNDLRGNLATQALAIAWLLRQWLLPLWPNIDPDLPMPHDLSLNGPLLLLVALLTAIPLTVHRRPWLCLAIAWTLIQWLPLHLILPRLDVANDRQMLLAGWPLAMLLGTELALRLERRTFLATATALLLACAGLTVARNRDYASEIALWEATARLSPDKARVRNNLGYAYRLAGRTAEARREYRRALALDPGYYKAAHNLARLEKDAP